MTAPPDDFFAWAKLWALTSRPMRAVALLLAAATALSSFALPAMAEPNAADRALATELFRQGRELMAQKKYEEACPRLEESQRLDPGGGTLLNLALCNEGLGKTATAWFQLNEAIAIAQRDGRRDREDLAQQHVEALEPHLSRLVIEVPAEADIAGLIVIRDGSTVARVAWGSAMPVDPGEHRIEISAVGRVTWTTTITMGADADRQRVTAPVLELAPLPEPAKPVELPSPLPQPKPLEPSPEPKPPSFNIGRLLGIVTIDLGAAALVAGSITAGYALKQKNESDAACPFDHCSTLGADKSDAAIQAADAATALFVVGTLTVAGGIALVIMSPNRRPVSVLPVIGRSGLAVLVGGDF